MEESGLTKKKKNNFVIKWKKKCQVVCHQFHADCIIPATHLKLI